MNNRLIRRVVNALATQQRIIIHLICGHNQSVTLREVQAAPHRTFEVGGYFPCPDCPDPPPEEEKPIDPMEAFYRASSGEES